MSVFIVAVDISSAGGSDMFKGSVLSCLRDMLLRSQVSFRTQHTSHPFPAGSFFFTVLLPALSPSRATSAVVWIPITAKGSGYSYPLPPPWVGKHPSCVWSLEGAYAWHQLITPETGLCLARVGRAKISSCEAHQTLFILFWTGSHFCPVGREPLFNSQKDTR